MISKLFPNAIIIADRFQVVLQAYRALNLVRINIMKTFKANSPEYRQLKKFNRLILKDSNELNYTNRKSRINFRHVLLTDTEVIDRILALSVDLKTAYNFYQDILFGIKKRDKAYLLATIVANNTFFAINYKKTTNSNYKLVA